MHVDFCEYLGIGIRALGPNVDLAAGDFLAASLEDHHDIEGSTAACAGQHHFHGARREIAATGFRRTVHGDQVTTTRFGNEAHAIVPAYLAFHACRPLQYSGKGNFSSGQASNSS